MTTQEQLAEEFESHREHLRTVAYRMLGSTAEADDAVQESWLRLARSDPSDVLNLRGWLTTVVSRIPDRQPGPHLMLLCRLRSVCAPRRGALQLSCAADARSR